jgi:hypothetical protein
MVARPTSLRATVSYLMHCTYWLQKKYGRDGVPATSPNFLEWDKNPKAAVPTAPKQITECMVLPAEGFINFVLDSEYRATLNHDFAKGGLLIVQGLDTYNRKLRLKKLNKTLRELVDDPTADQVAKLTANIQHKEMVPPEIISYPCVFSEEID